jgi:hypothetical protein
MTAECSLWLSYPYRHLPHCVYGSSIRVLAFCGNPLCLLVTEVSAHHDAATSAFADGDQIPSVCALSSNCSGVWVCRPETDPRGRTAPQSSDPWMQNLLCPQPVHTAAYLAYSQLTLLPYRTRRLPPISPSPTSGFSPNSASPRLPNPTHRREWPAGTVHRGHRPRRPAPRGPSIPPIPTWRPTPDPTHP